ncbi:endonuclease/exonuclease/phosphatase family protein [Limnohabitans sp.]|uniref:endonuclease/exonuclease/phosphatase family protein n=1 Tax=Limnohabitans sp. TaxID=1907725 RepID=UPI00391DF117
MNRVHHDHPVLRVATWNIHKGVQGLGPARRLEIHNIGHAVEQLDADLICLQEVRFANRREQSRFSRWPELPQADFLAPEGYQPVYRTNAITRHGEHGNALLSRWPVLSHRHEDMSDHRFEQRGLLHAEVKVAHQTVHVLVVHLGLVPASRVRQVEQLKGYLIREVPAKAPVLVAGDFNDWGQRITRMMAQAGLNEWVGEKILTYPSRLPLAHLDHVYARGLHPLGATVPRGRIWQRMSDHLPLLAEFALE